MEADWEFEVGGDAPVIDACWPGIVDLRLGSEDGRDLAARIASLPEVAQFPALGVALARLNAKRSPVWTSKCDFWPALGDEDFDADELDAPTGSIQHALGCYIDLLPESDQPWTNLGANPGAILGAIPAKVEADCRALCGRMRAFPLRGCRVDLIIRRALVAPGVMDTGVTAYFTAGGATAGEAGQTLESALAAFVDALMDQPTVQ